MMHSPQLAPLSLTKANAKESTFQKKESEVVNMLQSLQTIQIDEEDNYGAGEPGRSQSTNCKNRMTGLE